MERLDSASNEKIKFAVKIATSARQRRDNKLFFLEGLRLCKDAALTGTVIEYAFFRDKISEKFADEVDFISSKAKRAFVVSKKVEEKLSQTESSQGVFCLCRMADKKIDIDPKGKYIALENVQDPANLGAICRTAEALGIDGAILCGGCDVYSPKAQRAAMGSLLRLPILECGGLAESIVSYKKAGMKVYATVPSNEAKSIVKADMSGGVVAIIGNEANGIGKEVLDICDKITIPMLGRAESLNASVAAALTMWEMMRTRGEENV